MMNMQKSDDSRVSVGSSNPGVQTSSYLNNSVIGPQAQKRKKLSVQINDNFQNQVSDSQTFTRGQLTNKSNMMTI